MRSPAAIAFASITAILALGGCGGSTAVTNVVGPDAARCQTSLAAQTTTVSPDGGRVTVGVSSARDCTWTAASDVSWIQLSTASGQGDGSITATVARNEQATSRAGAIAVNDQRLSLSQEPRPCVYELTSLLARMSHDGGRGSIGIASVNGCTWTAASTTSWVRVLTASGNGSGTVEFEVAANAGPPRETTITIANQPVVIIQDAAQGGPNPLPLPDPNCQATLRPGSIDVPAGGGSHTLTLEIAAPCSWSASVSAPWLSLATASGRGDATIAVTIARNTEAARTATVTVAGQRATINQAAAPACTVTIAPASLSFPASGGEGSVRVTTPDGCGWTATGGAAWTALTSSTGSGNGDMRYTVAANTSTSARSGAITIGGQSHSINQQGAACTFSLEPTALSFASSGGEGRVRVTTQSGCQWTATSSVAWAVVSSGSGTGSGEFTYSVPNNTETAPRSATITAGGQSHAVTQAGAAPTCTFSLEPASLSFSATGGEGRVRVQTQANCQWSASSGSGWAVLNAGSGGGTGPGEILYSVQPNTVPTARSTTITVSGQAHTVSQAAAPTCTYSIAPVSLNFAAGGGDGRFTVTTQAGCTWSASSGAGWAVVSAGAGTGSGDVVYAVQANTVTSPRSTSITVGGQSHAITQAAAATTCTYSIAPASLTFAAAGGEGKITITTQTGCTWSASSGAGWAVITTGTGTGSGEAVYTVQANTVTSQRSTTITVAGQPHGVSQAAAPPPCTYSIAPSSRNFAAAGGEGRVTVTTQAGCAWSGSSGAAWAAVTTGSGTGPGDLVYSVQANTATSSRSTTIVINGQTHTVTQDAAPPPPCTYTLEPTSLTFTAAGGEGRFRVSTQNGCAWSASSGASWAVVTTGGGTGTGEAVYTVQSNTTAATRSTTITVAGRTHSVSQAAAGSN